MDINSSQDHQYSDDELIILAYRGDQQAFGTLYERYLTPVYRYVYFRVLDPVDAEDLTEAVFIKAWEAINTVRIGNFNFKAWIYRIAHNLVVDRYRTLHQEVSLDSVNGLHEPNSSPEHLIGDKEDMNEIASVMARLDPTMQEVLIYRFIIGLSHAETAEIMDKSIVNVRVLQHRAITKLKKILYRENGKNGQVD